MFSFNINKVNFEEELGEGAHGAVYAYKQKNPEDDEYVVKRITTPKVDILLMGMQEIVLGFSCDHHHVVPISGYHIGFDRISKLWSIYMKMPRMETSLKERINQYVREEKSFTEDEIVKYFYSLTLGLRYLHEKNIAHRDIKPDNILIDKHGQLKIADIGIGKLIEDENTETLTRVFGTPLYTAPEVLTHASNNKLKKKGLFVADIWSLGVIMAEICVPKTRLINVNVSGKENEANLVQILEGLEGKYSKVLLDLICGMTKADPQERKSLEEVQKILEENFSAILGLPVSERAKEAALQQENEALKLYIQHMKKQIQHMEEQMKALAILTQDINKNLFSMREESFMAELGPEKLLDISPVIIKHNEEQKVEEIKPEKVQFQGECIKTLTGHTDIVCCLQTLPTDEFASGSADKTIRIWNSKTGNCVKILTGHTETVCCLQRLQTGELVSSSIDKTIKLWDLNTSSCIITLTGHTNTVRCLQVLPSGELVSASFDQTIKLWNLQTGNCLNTLTGHTGDIYCIQLLPADMLASGSYDKTIRIWDLRAGNCLKTLQGHQRSIRCLQVLSTGELVSGSSDQTIKIWNLQAGTCLRTLTGHSSNVECLQILPTGELVSGSTDKTIKIWDLETDNCIKTLVGHTKLVVCLQILSTGELASGSYDTTIRLWN